jgi:hypothetical protein
MQPRWPIGLRVVFWLVVFAFLVSTGQLAYYFIIKREYPYVLANGNPWVFCLYGLAILTVSFGAFRLRRFFTVSTTIGCLLSIMLNVYYTAELLEPFWQSAASGALNVGSLLTVEGWYITWNAICFSIDAGLLLYILSYEYKLFGPGKMTRHGRE